MSLLVMVTTQAVAITKQAEASQWANVEVASLVARILLDCKEISGAHDQDKTSSSVVHPRVSESWQRNDFEARGWTWHISLSKKSVATTVKWLCHHAGMRECEGRLLKNHTHSEIRNQHTRSHHRQCNVQHRLGSKPRHQDPKSAQAMALAAPSSQPFECRSCVPVLPTWSRTTAAQAYAVH